MGVVLLALAGLALADPCDPGVQAEAAQQAFLELDVPRVEEALRAAEEAMACGGAVEPDVLARLWLIEGSILLFEGDSQSSAEAFSAAARVAPDQWIPDLGAKVRAVYEEAAANPPSTTGEIILEPDTGHIAVLDGAVVAFPATVPTGLHVVQVGNGSHMEFAQIISVARGVNRVFTDLDPIDSKPEDPEPEEIPPEQIPPEPPPVEPKTLFSGMPLELQFSTGSALALGQTRSGTTPEDDDLNEPAAKVLVPVEVGVSASVRGAWFRGAGVVAPVVSGPLLYTVPGGVHGARLGFGGHVAGGLVSGPTYLGALAGVTLPSRIALQGLAGLHLADLPLCLEIRVGTNLLSGAGPELSTGLNIAYKLPI